MQAHPDCSRCGRVPCGNGRCPGTFSADPSSNKLKPLTIDRAPRSLVPHPVPDPLPAKQMNTSQSHTHPVRIAADLRRNLFAGGAGQGRGNRLDRRLRPGSRPRRTAQSIDPWERGILFLHVPVLSIACSNGTRPTRRSPRGPVATATLPASAKFKIGRLSSTYKKDPQRGHASHPATTQSPTSTLSRSNSIQSPIFRRSSTRS